MRSIQNPVMNILLPQTYLIGLLGLLLIIAILIGRQLLRVRQDELKLVKLEKDGGSSSEKASELYELASVQLKKRLYPQAVSSLTNALKYLDEEPDEARAVIENALGFSMAAQDNFKSAVKHYKQAIKAKDNYPVALNNLAFAKQKLLQEEEAAEIYEKVLTLDPNNKTARKQLEKITKRNIDISPKSSARKGF